jgi:3,4-dihydroxy 2-butanone 4-phosphate synthase/GTP cyclohydrolase II
MDLLDAESTHHSWNLNDALKALDRAGSGVIVLLQRTDVAQELLNRVKPEDETKRPWEKIALRNYGIGAQILRDLRVRKMRLLAAPRKMPSMAGFDLEVTGYLQPQQD